MIGWDVFTAILMRSPHPLILWLRVGCYFPKLTATRRNADHPELA